MVDSADMMTFDAKVGNPWSILPIKNKKYAKDLVEVHLSDRSLNSLTNFESFPNLEVIWLNNNAVSQLAHQLLYVSNLCQYVNQIASNFFSYGTSMTLQAISVSKSFTVRTISSAMLRASVDSSSCRCFWLVITSCATWTSSSSSFRDSHSLSS